MSGRTLFRVSAARNPRSLNFLQVRSAFKASRRKSPEVPCRRTGSRFICPRDIRLYRTRDVCSLADAECMDSECLPGSQFPLGFHAECE